jgi:hypothetical protein
LIADNNLSAEWFKWFYSTKEEPRLPYKYNDEVIFLATKEMGRNDKQILEITDQIPKLPILFPVDKWLSLGFPFTPDEKLKAVAQERIDLLVNMELMINDQKVRPVRLTSDVFNITIKRDIYHPEVPENLKKIYKGKYKAVCDGWWLFTKLEKGKHEIHSFASCASGVLALEVNHSLNVG